MNTNTIWKPLGAIFVMTLIALPLTAGESSPAERAFERFKALEGEWTGTGPEGKTIETRYELVGEGTSVMEFFSIEGEHDMLTVYHLDGDSLMLTHYCAAGNQPRMRAASFEDENEVSFDFVDVTGVPSPEAGHMHHAVIEFKNDDRVESHWTWFEGGEAKFTESIEIERVAAR